MKGRSGKPQCDVCGSRIEVVHVSELEYLRSSVAGWIQDLCRIHAGWYRRPEPTRPHASGGRLA